MAKWIEIILIYLMIAVVLASMLGACIGGNLVAGRWWRAWATKRCDDLEALDVAASTVGLTRPGAFDPKRKDERNPKCKGFFGDMFAGGFDGDGGGGADGGGGDGGGGDG